MKNFMDKKNSLTEGQINELLYYYQQGIEIGKEEATFNIINILYNLGIAIDIISKATNYEHDKILNIVEFNLS